MRDDQIGIWWKDMHPHGPVPHVDIAKMIEDLAQLEKSAAALSMVIDGELCKLGFMAYVVVDAADGSVHWPAKPYTSTGLEKDAEQLAYVGIIQLDGSVLALNLELRDTVFRSLTVFRAAVVETFHRRAAAATKE